MAALSEAKIGVLARANCIVGRCVEFDLVKAKTLASIDFNTWSVRDAHAYLDFVEGNLEPLERAATARWELLRAAKWADEGAEEYYSWQEKD